VHYLRPTWAGPAGVGCRHLQLRCVHLPAGQQSVKICTVLALHADGASHHRGRARPTASMHAVSEGIPLESRAQCGYCNRGQMIMSRSTSYLHPDPSEQAVRTDAEGNLSGAPLSHIVKSSVEASLAELRGWRGRPAVQAAATDTRRSADRDVPRRRPMTSDVRSSYILAPKGPRVLTGQTGGPITSRCLVCCTCHRAQPLAHAASPELSIGRPEGPGCPSPSFTGRGLAPEYGSLPTAWNASNDLIVPITMPIATEEVTILAKKFAVAVVVRPNALSCATRGRCRPGRVHRCPLSST